MVMRASQAASASCSHRVEANGCSVTLLLLVLVRPHLQNGDLVWAPRARRVAAKWGECSREPPRWWGTGAHDTGGEAEGTGLVLAWRREGEGV